MCAEVVSALQALRAMLRSASVACVLVGLLVAACSAPASEDVESGDDALVSCAPAPACNGSTAPNIGAPRGFRHLKSRLATWMGHPHHRGRDQIYSAGEAQWVLGKIAYGITDKDLEDEDVDVWVERGCSGAWEKLGTARSSDEGSHPAVDGVNDGGGRVFFRIPDDKKLGIGRHRVRLVVAGDGSSTDLSIDVVAKGTKIAVSDVDGTLTSSENVEFAALLTGTLPEAQPHAAEALSALAAKGYRIVYLTARPEWLDHRTHEFLAARGFPPGIVHTTTTATGAIGAAAATYKSEELSRLALHGVHIAWAFGNKPSDTDAYDAARVEPRDHRVFLRVTDTHGGRRIEDYADVVPVIASSPAACQ